MFSNDAMLVFSHIKKYRHRENIDLEIPTYLIISSPPDYENVVSGMPPVCMDVCHGGT
jgi:hypothetical protein